MKRFRRISISVLMLLIGLFLYNEITVQASSTEIMKEQWYETHDYPISLESRNVNNYGLTETLDILNPPEDLIHTLTTQELAALMMDYPYLWVLGSYDYNERDYFFDFVEENCAIYNELLSREDGIVCLLNEYQNTDFNVRLYNENPYIIWENNPVVNAEVFGCQFIVYNLNTFNDVEMELCYEIVNEKTKLYSAIENNDTKRYLEFVKENENTYTQADIANLQDSMLIRTTNGFVSNGSPYIKSIEGVNIYFTPGIYYRYGTSANCLQWYSGDYSDSKKEALDNSIAFSWYRLSTSSPKYNCHSYAWLNASVSSPYWLDEIQAYTNSSSVSYVGSNNPSLLQTGDIIVMYRNSTGAISHSAIITQKPSGAEEPYTISKLSGRGVYKAPLSELGQYYSSSSYDIYRIN